MAPELERTYVSLIGNANTPMTGTLMSIPGGLDATKRTLQIMVSLVRQ